MNSGIIVGAVFFSFFLLQLLVRLNLEKKIVINKYLAAMFGSLTILIAYSFLIAILTGSKDFQVFKNYLSFLFFYIPGAFGIVMLLKKYFTAADAIKVFILATVMQSIIMVAMLVNPAIKDFFFALLKDTDARMRQNQISGGFRFLGLALGGSWDLSIVQSLGIMSLALLIKTGQYKINIKTVLFFLILTISTFLAGRTGIFGILLSLLLLIIPVKRSEVPLYKISKFIVFLCLVTVPLFYFIRGRIPDKVADILQSKFVPWAIEMFQNDNGTVLETRSSNDLKTMYFMPATNTILLGDGYYKNQQDANRYYMDTDAGYMRHILFYGIPGTLLQLCFYLLLFYQMYKFSNVLQPYLAAQLFVVFLSIYFFISHIKGDLLGGADMPIKTLFFLYAVLFSAYTKTKLQHSMNQ